MQSVLLNSKTLAVAQAAAASTHLPLNLVLAHIKVESAGDSHAMRCEPGYRYLWDNLYKRAFRALTAEEIDSATPPADFSVPPQLAISKTTEWWMQRSSWGRMQVMGAVAREFGFTGNMPALCDSDGTSDIFYGCQLLKRYANTYSITQGWEAVSAAYNAGSPRRVQQGAGVGPFENQAYVDKIAAAGGFEGLS